MIESNMNKAFDELDNRDTPIGKLSLRTRREDKSGNKIYEIKLGEEYLMSSLFTVSEEALGSLGVDEHTGEGLHVIVGGLGLGYTARAVLEDPRVKSLIVVEALEIVIDWHRSGLLPLGRALTDDPRCSFVHGDFFAMSASSDGFDLSEPGRRFDAILLDIDHSPHFHLDPVNAAFYTPAGLQQLRGHLTPGGIFGLWSDDPSDADFTALLNEVFSSARGKNITFYNPLQDQDCTQAVYLSRK
jgi:spermidine synthase